MTIGGRAARITPSSGIVTWKSESTSSRKASKGSSARSSSSMRSTGGSPPEDSSAWRIGRLMRYSAEKRSRSSEDLAAPVTSARRIAVIWRWTFHSYTALETSRPS